MTWTRFTIAKRGRKRVTILSVEFPPLDWFLIFPIPIRVWKKTSSSSQVNGTMVCIAQDGGTRWGARGLRVTRVPSLLLLASFILNSCLTSFLSLFLLQTSSILLQIATWWISQTFIGFCNPRFFSTEIDNFGQFTWSMDSSSFLRTFNPLNTWSKPKIWGLY